MVADTVDTVQLRAADVLVAIGQGDRFPADCPHLDIPVSEAEYAEYLEAVAYPR